MLLTSAFGAGVGVVTVALYAASLVAAAPRPVFPSLAAVAQAAWRARGGTGSGEIPEPERRIAGDAVAPVGGWSEDMRRRVEQLAALPTAEARWVAMTAAPVSMPPLSALLGPDVAAFPSESAWGARARRAGVGVLHLAEAPLGAELDGDAIDDQALIGLDERERDAVLGLARKVLAAEGADGWVVCLEGLDGLRWLRAMAAVVPARDRVRAVVLLDAPLRGDPTAEVGAWAPSTVADWMATWFRHERFDVEWLRPVPWLTARRAGAVLPDAPTRAAWASGRLPEPGFVGDGGWFRAQEPATLVVADLGVFVVEGDDVDLWPTLAAVGVVAALAAAG